MTHTKGEWELDITSDDIVIMCEPYEQIIARLIRYEENTPCDEINDIQQLANARLIASAPVLLEACIKAHDSLLSLHTCDLDKERCENLRKELRQAIKKAKETK